MLKTKYIALAITLGSIPLQSNAAVFDGASHCSEDVIYKTQALNNLIASVGDIQALKTKALEKVGSTENGYFLFDPQFSRSARYFNCSVPQVIHILGSGGAAYGILSALLSYNIKIVYISIFIVIYKIF